MNLLKESAEKIGINLTDEMLEQFRIYSEFLIEYNEKVNLTAITEPEEILIKHFLDSIQLLSVFKLKENATVCDIGTGAGFPGLPLKIVRPDIRLTLLDSLNKRLVFLEELMDKIGIEAKLVHARAEDAAKETPFREGYDLVVSRAVTRLPALSEYCIPFVSIGGYFVAYKGPDYADELKDAKNAIKKMGGKRKKVEELTLPDGGNRTLILIEKVMETPDKYPRKGIKIAGNPL